MTSTAARVRAWRGPALLSYGFRPFFLFAGVWAWLAMALWLAMLAGLVRLPTAFDPVSWHAHEALFGYLGAVVAGFLLTAVPNWTGRLPIVGWSLGGLAALWLAGRVAVAFSAHLPPLAVALADLSGLAVLACVLAREIVAGRNWRNLGVLAMLCLLLLGNALFHWEAAQGLYAAAGTGFRLGLAAAVMMIVMIGGRIVPSFTRNWLVKRGSAARPATLGNLDRLSIFAMLAGLLLWVAAADAGGVGGQVTGAALLLAGALHFARLAGWAGIHTTAEPLVWILHLAYAFVPLGAVALGLSLLLPTAVAAIGAQHLWMAGAIGSMTLAVMTRATLGHTGQPLAAGKGTAAIYLAVVAAAIVRFCAGLEPEWASPLYTVSGLLWCVAFVGFTLLYGLRLLRRAATG